MKRKLTLMTHQEPLRNLSRNQYGALRFIGDNNVTLRSLRMAHAGTISSLAYHDWIRKLGAGEDAAIILTAKGEEELRSYEHAILPERKVEHDLTDRTMRLLKMTRNIVAMKNNSAA
jgi:hypothetical protein